MRKKWVTCVLIAMVMLVGLSAKIYGVSNDITGDELTNPNNRANQVSIADKVITAMGLSEGFDPEDVERITVYYSDVYNGDEKEAVIAVKMGPKNTLVAVYTPNGEDWKYVGEIGSFFDVQSIQFVPISDLDSNLVFLTEFADQRIGAYEKDTFVRGFVWDDDKFKMVLNIPESIIATWNELWDTGDFVGDSKWNRITQSSDFNWQEGKYPSLEISQKQAYSISNNKDAKNIPDDSSFQEVNNRTVAQKYMWSDEWKNFILSEKNDKTTGQKVAILEDFSLSPYVLLGENFEKYRIQRKDGTIDIVDKSTLSDLKVPTKEPVFMVN